MTGPNLALIECGPGRSPRENRISKRLRPDLAKNVVPPEHSDFIKRDPEIVRNIHLQFRSAALPVLCQVNGQISWGVTLMGRRPSAICDWCYDELIGKQVAKLSEIPRDEN